MATSAIGAGDITILRSTTQFSKSLKVDITPLVEVQSGTVTALPSTYPTVSLTWDGSTTGIVTGQLVKITSGGTLKTWAIIRKAPVSSTLYISTTPLGASGYAENIESAIAVNDTVTVYNHHPLWGLYSRINKRTFYKQWDLAYSDQNSNVPPVANAGAWQTATITSGTASFTLPRAGSNTSFAMSGTVSSYLWTLPSGVTLQAGYATSDSVIEVDADPGRYLISLKVTDSNAKTHTAYTWLFVSDGTTGTSLSERYAITGANIESSQRGFTGSLELIGTDLADVLYPGAGIMLTETPYFSGGTLTDGVFVDTHIGYIVDVNYTYDNGRISRASVTFESPVIYADRVIQPVQSMTEKSSPANWTQVTSALSNPRGAFYYAVKWHFPALLDMHDVSASGFTTPRRKFIEFNTDTAGAAISSVASMFLCNIGSLSNGTTYFGLYPQYMDNTDRNSLATRLLWQAQDFLLPVRYRKNMVDKPAEVKTGAFAFDGSKTIAKLAGKLWNQGTGSETFPNFTVTVAEGLTRIKEVVGHVYAEKAAKIKELTFDINGNMDVIEPAAVIWDTLTSSSDYDPDGVGWSTDRMIAKRVTRNWTKGEGGLEKTLTITWQPETFGQPGVEIPIGNVKSKGSNVAPVAFAPKASDALGQLGIMMAVNDVGQLAVTYNYLATSPVWNDLSGYFAGAVNDFCWDYNSDYFTSGYVLTASLDAYVVSIDTTDFNVYRISDLLNTPTVELLTTLTMSDSSMDYEGRIECSETTPTLAVAIFKDQTGVEHTYTTDGGSTWSSKANIGSAISDTDNDDAPLGLSIYGTTILVTAPDSTPEYGLYVSTAGTPSFSQVTNTELASTPFPMVKVVNTNAFVTVQNTTSTTSDTVTFDVGGYGTYSVTDTGMTSGVNAVGNPGNAAQGTSASSSTGQRLTVEITLGAAESITDVTLDYYANITGQSTTSWDITIRNGGSGGTLVKSSTLDNNLDANGNWTSRSASATTASTWTAPYVGDWIQIQIRSSNTHTGADLRLDNIAVTYLDSGGGGGVTTTTLYKVTGFTGGSTWTDISPAADEAPVRPHDFAWELITAGDIYTVTNAGDYLTSADAGSNWTTEESSTDKRVPYVVGDAIAFGGNGEAVLSLDAGANFDDKTGSLAVAWGTVSIIKRLLAL